MERTKAVNYLAWGLSGILAGGAIALGILGSYELGSQQGHRSLFKQAYNSGRENQREIDDLMIENAREFILSGRGDELARRAEIMLCLMNDNGASSKRFLGIYKNMKAVYEEANKNSSSIRNASL